MDCPSTLFGGTMGCVAQTETQTGGTITAITANVLNPEDTSKLICFPTVSQLQSRAVKNLIIVAMKDGRIGAVIEFDKSFFKHEIYKSVVPGIQTLL